MRIWLCAQFNRRSRTAPTVIPVIERILGYRSRTHFESRFQCQHCRSSPPTSGICEHEWSTLVEYDRLNPEAGLHSQDVSDSQLGADDTENLLNESQLNICCSDSDHQFDERLGVSKSTGFRLFAGCSIENKYAAKKKRSFSHVLSIAIKVQGSFAVLYPLMQTATSLFF